MKLATVTDVHALQDALVQIERLGCDAIVCMGDLFDYGCFPDETIGLLMERNIPCIRGNHDRWAVLKGRGERTWRVSHDAITFLPRLPLSWSATIEGVRVLAWHARPGSDMLGVYPDVSEMDAAALLDAAVCDVLLVGHTQSRSSGA